MMIAKLESLGQLFQGLTVSRYANNSGETERVVQIRHLDHYYVDSDLDFLKLNAPNLERYCLQSNDVVLTIRGTVKKASVVNAETENAIVGQNLAVFRPISEKINPLYLVVILRSQWIDNSLSKLYGQSTGTRSVSLKQLKQLEIPVLERERQIKIAELFYALEEMAIASQKAVEARMQVAESSLSQWLQ